MKSTVIFIGLFITIKFLKILCLNALLLSLVMNLLKNSVKNKQI